MMFQINKLRRYPKNLLFFFFLLYYFYNRFSVEGITNDFINRFSHSVEVLQDFLIFY